MLYIGHVYRQGSVEALHNYIGIWGLGILQFNDF